MPRMREPDFSDVRRHIFKPWKIVIFIIASIIFWLGFYRMLPGCEPRQPDKVQQRPDDVSGHNQKSVK